MVQRDAARSPSFRSRVDLFWNHLPKLLSSTITFVLPDSEKYWIISTSCNSEKIFILMDALRNFVAKYFRQKMSIIFILFSAPRCVIGRSKFAYSQIIGFIYKSDRCIILRRHRDFRREITRWGSMLWRIPDDDNAASIGLYRCNQNAYIAVLSMSLDRVLAELARSGTSGISIGRQTDRSTGEYIERLQI